MKKIDPYSITHFKFYDKTLYILSNIDEFKIPFVRLVDDTKYCDISISDNPIIIDSNSEFDIKYIREFILKYKDILLSHWAFGIDSVELTKKIKI